MADQLQEQNPYQERRQLWQTHIEAWPLTGLSQAEYCRQNNLKATRFTYWKRKFQKESLPVEFVRIFAEPARPDICSIIMKPLYVLLWVPGSL